MAGQNSVNTYLEEHARDIHPVTGRPPVILGELRHALSQNPEAAKALLENYEAHGRIELPEGYSPRGPEKVI